MEKRQAASDDEQEASDVEEEFSDSEDSEDEAIAPRAAASDDDAGEAEAAEEEAGEEGEEEVEEDVDEVTEEEGEEIAAEGAAEEEVAVRPPPRKRLEPFEVPKSGAYWLHDDRHDGGQEEGEEEGQQRPAVERESGKKLWDPFDEQKWGHDGFEALMAGRDPDEADERARMMSAFQGGRGRGRGRRGGGPGRGRGGYGGGYDAEEEEDVGSYGYGNGASASRGRTRGGGATKAAAGNGYHGYLDTGFGAVGNGGLEAGGVDDDLPPPGFEAPAPGRGRGRAGRGGRGAAPAPAAYAQGPSVAGRGRGRGRGQGGRGRGRHAAYGQEQAGYGQDGTQAADQDWPSLPGGKQQPARQPARQRQAQRQGGSVGRSGSTQALRVDAQNFDPGASTAPAAAAASAAPAAPAAPAPSVMAAQMDSSQLATALQQIALGGTPSLVPMQQPQYQFVPVQMAPGMQVQMPAGGMQMPQMQQLVGGGTVLQTGAGMQPMPMQQVQGMQPIQYVAVPYAQPSDGSMQQLQYVAQPVSAPLPPQVVKRPLTISAPPEADGSEASAAPGTEAALPQRPGGGRRYSARQ